MTAEQQDQCNGDFAKVAPIISEILPNNSPYWAVFRNVFAIGFSSGVCCGFHEAMDRTNKLLDSAIQKASQL